MQHSRRRRSANIGFFAESAWRYNRAPDYSASNIAFENTKTTDWQPGSLEFLIQNLVKNWEKEASYKTDPKEWRTISQEKYDFHLNGGPAMSAEDMLKLGTYNALIGTDGVKGVYETSAVDFTASHKLFKGAIRSFNWEVLEVLGAPPKVSVKWRHWGTLRLLFIQQVALLTMPRRQDDWKLPGKAQFGPHRHGKGVEQGH